MASRHFIAGPGDTLRLRVRFLLNGNLVDPGAFPSNVGVFLGPSGGTAVTTIAPVQEAAGIWYIDYTLPGGFASTVLYDEWTWTGEPGMPSFVQRYESEIDLTSVPAPLDEAIPSPTDAIGHVFASIQKVQDTPPKSGFVVKAVPKSVREAVSQHSHDRLKSITKSAIEQYIRSFLDTDGRNRSIIESVAKGSLQFITDKSLQVSNDKTRRATQLARLFNDIRERVPAILIVDAGMESVPTGLNSGLTNSTLLDGKWQGWFTKHFRVPLTIVVLTADQDSTDQLMEILELCFNNLRQIGGGSEIRPDREGHNWVVRLPLGIDISATSGANITEDNKDQLWFAEFSMTVDSEDTFAIEMPFDTSLDPDDYAEDFRSFQTQESNLGARIPPIITAPDTMQVNQQVVVSFARMRNSHRIQIDQPMIATIDITTRTITARRLGSFNLQVVDYSDRDDGQGPRALAPVVSVQKVITVTL